MQDEPFFILGTLDGAEVGVESTREGQDILIRHSEIAQSLACLLGSGNTDIVRQRGASYWRIVHDRRVDSLLVELIDLFISIRYAHPALVQLELALPIPGSTEGSNGEGTSQGPTGP